VSTERGRSASRKKITGKTTPAAAAAENEEAKEAPTPKKMKDETGQAKLVAPSSLKKSETVEQVLRVSKMEGFDKADAARIRELAAQMEGADAKTLRRIQQELLVIYRRNYRLVKAANAETAEVEASTASSSRVKAGKAKATPEDERVVGMLENMINSPGFIQEDVAKMARLVKKLRGDVDDADRELITNELRKMHRRNAAAIREHRKQHGAPGMQGQGHRIGDEPKKGKKSDRSRSRTPAASSSGPARSRSVPAARSSSTPVAFRGTAMRLD
jgi:hypothetical protein